MKPSKLLLLLNLAVAGSAIGRIHRRASGRSVLRVAGATVAVAGTRD